MKIKMNLSRQQATIRRFGEVCQADPRVVAAFLGGSQATGTTDAHSDLDLYLIVSDEAYDDFYAKRRRFMRSLGDPVFLEDFDGFGFDMLVFILANGVEGELALARESHFTHIHGGPFKIVVDKKGILEGVTFPRQGPSPTEQQETLRHLLHWFWRDLSLFCTAMARGRLWTAYGYLEALRRKCLNLARLQADFGAWAGGYEKVEEAVSPGALAPLQATFGPLQRQEMVQAARRLVVVYQQVAPGLAAQRGVPYPAQLERVLLERWRALLQL